MQFSSNENFATHIAIQPQNSRGNFFKLGECFSKVLCLCVLQTHLPVLIRAFTWRWACPPQVSGSFSFSLTFPLSLYCYSIATTYAYCECCLIQLPRGLLHCYSIATYVYCYLLNPAPKRTNEEAQPEAAKKPRIEVGPLLLSAQISLFLLFLLLDI